MIIKAAKNLLKPPLYFFDRTLFLSGLRSLKTLTLPDFLVLGSGQSGSSWLHNVLGTHPDIYLPIKKETHYFSRYLHEWPLSYYSQLFSAGANAIKGEITPGYNLLRSDRIKLVHAIVPEVKLILIVRNPIERSWSEARRSLSKVAESSGTSLGELDDSMFYEYFEKEWMYRPEYGGAFEVGLLQGEYSRVIDNWLSVFPAEQLHVCFFQQIESDPLAFLAAICEHIGVDPNFSWKQSVLRTVVNKNPEHRMPERFRKTLEARYSSEIEQLYRRFGEPVSQWLVSKTKDRHNSM